MIEAPIPANESDRLAALHKTRLMDSPIEERFERITRLACRILGVPIASITLVDETRQWFKSIQGSDLAETPRQVAFCAHTILDEDTTVVPDATKDQRFADNPFVTGPANVKFYAGQPLHAADGSRIGVLCAIDHKPRQLSDEDVQSLRDLAFLAEGELNAHALVDTQKELISQLDTERRKALTDPLTRLWNREGILEILKREHAKALRSHQRLGVLMTDIDHFKRVNDTHGHPVGDEVIRAIAKALLKSFRDFDAVGRFGGEEFLVVMPINRENTDVQMIASRVCRQIAASPIATAAGRLNVTMSCGGVDEHITASINIDDLIKRADDALYQAKHLGRNRAIIANTVGQLNSLVMGPHPSN